MRPVDPLYTFLPHIPPPLFHNDFLSDENSVSTSAESPQKEDRYHFGREWPKIHPHLEDNLDMLILQRREEIELQKELFRPLIEQEMQGEGKSFYDDFTMVLSKGSIKPYKYGGGGVYFLCDDLGEPCFVIKPSDEAICCLNNPKHRGSPFSDSSHRLRDDIPLYKTCETEAAVSLIAKSAGIGSCMPETRLMILTSSCFYDLTGHFEGIENEQVIARAGKPNAEKLCSVQRFIPDSIDLRQALHEWFESGLEDLSPLPIDQEEFEEVLLLLWLTYDGDGHSSNFRLFFKGFDDQNQVVYGIRKIDNGLCLPEKNHYLLNYLGYFPNAKLLPSTTLLNKIAQLDEKNLCRIIDYFQLSYAKSALKERVEVLKTLSQRPMITLEELNLRFELLGLPDGKNLALSPLTLEELTDSIQPAQSTASGYLPSPLAQRKPCLDYWTEINSETEIHSAQKELRKKKPLTKDPMRRSAREFLVKV